MKSDLHGSHFTFAVGTCQPRETETHQIILEPLDCAIGLCYTLRVLNWALVVGRSRGRADGQGTRCDSGTAHAAVTECFKVCPNLLAIVGQDNRRKPARRREGRTTELGSQKTYQRRACGPLLGQRPRRRGTLTIRNYRA